MSVKIGELSDSLISFYPVFILSNNKNWATEVSDTNKLFAILNNYKTLSYCFDENCFTVKKQQLDQLISQLKDDEIPFEIQAEKPSSLRRTAGRLMFCSAYMVTNLHPSKSNMKKARFGGSCKNQTPKELF